MHYLLMVHPKLIVVFNVTDLKYFARTACYFLPNFIRKHQVGFIASYYFHPCLFYYQRPKSILDLSVGWFIVAIDWQKIIDRQECRHSVAHELDQMKAKIVLFRQYDSFDCSALCNHHHNAA